MVYCLLGLFFSLVIGNQPTSGESARQSSKYIFWHLIPAEGATPELTSRVEKELRISFEKQRGNLLMDGMTMDSLLVVEGNEKFLRCGVGPVCLAGIGQIAGIPWVIAGEVRLTEGRLEVELVLVDTSKKVIVSRSMIECAVPLSPVNLEELSVAMFEMERYRGSLDLYCEVEGALVLLDGKKVGVTPLVGPLGSIPAGKHSIEVKKTGYTLFSQEIRIPMGKTERVVALIQAESSPIPPKKPFYQDWAFWTFGGGGLIATVLAVIFHVDAGILQENANLKSKEHASDWRQVQDQADSRYLQSYIAYGIGGAGLLTAGVLSLLDLTGRGSTENKGRVVELQVTPGVSAIQLIATVRF